MRPLSTTVRCGSWKNPVGTETRGGKITDIHSQISKPLKHKRIYSSGLPEEWRLCHFLTLSNSNTRTYSASGRESSTFPCSHSFRFCGRPRRGVVLSVRQMWFLKHREARSLCPSSHAGCTVDSRREPGCLLFQNPNAKLPPPTTVREITNIWSEKLPFHKA